MTMYRVQSQEGRLEPFRSTAFDAHYQEKNLEDWLESNPEVLTDGEPILIIGRQVNTVSAGVLDLLALDAEGATIIAELKRVPTPRDIVAQVLEYAAWVDGLGGDGIRAIAEEYLSRQSPPQTLEQAWQQAFGGASGGQESSAVVQLPTLNERQRIFVVTEGANDRVTTVVKYLYAQGLPISLMQYNYYQTGGGEEILDVEFAVSETEEAPTPRPPARYTESALLADWNLECKDAYLAFRDVLTHDERIEMKVQKSAVSFYKQTRDARVFVCYVSSSNQRLLVNFRSDMLTQRMDFGKAVKAIRQAVGPGLRIKEGPVWCAIQFDAATPLALKLAEAIAEHISSKLE